MTSWTASLTYGKPMVLTCMSTCVQRAANSAENHWALRAFSRVLRSASDPTVPTHPCRLLLQRPNAITNFQVSHITEIIPDDFGYIINCRMCNTQKGPLFNLQTMQALISLRFWAGWSGPSLSAYRFIGFFPRLRIIGYISSDLANLQKCDIIPLYSIK